MKSFIDFQKEELELDEATVKTQKYSWGTMKTVHQGSDFSIPLHPEHHQEIAKLKDQQEHKFKDETGHHWTAKRSGDDVHFKGANGGNSTTVKHSTMSEEAELEEDTKYTPRFEYRQKVQPNINKHLDDRKTAGAHTAITYHKQSDGSTHAKVQYRNISHTNSSGVGPIQHKHFSVNKDHSVTPIKINEEQLDEARGKVVASYIQKAKEAMKKKIDMKRKTAQLNDPNSAEKKIVKESDLDEEQLDELSKNTLKSYITKATKDMGERKRQETIAINRSNQDRYQGKYAQKSALGTAKFHKDKALSRASGIGLAARKFAEEVESIDEGRPSQQHPLEGHDYHRKTNAELEYIAKDAHRAAEAMKSHNTTAENKYRDQASDSATVRHFRKTSGTPDWYKKKYGHVKEAVEPKDNKPPFEGPYKKTQVVVTDKSGAKHGSMSRARDLAKQAAKRQAGSMKEEKQKSRKAQIIKNASKGNDKFEKDPIITDTTVKTDNLQ